MAALMAERQPDLSCHCLEGFPPCIEQPASVHRRVEYLAELDQSVCNSLHRPLYSGSLSPSRRAELRPSTPGHNNTFLVGAEQNR